jgi:hypothetical protein
LYACPALIVVLAAPAMTGAEFTGAELETVTCSEKVASEEEAVPSLTLIAMLL